MSLDIWNKNLYCILLCFELNFVGKEVTGLVSKKYLSAVPMSPLKELNLPLQVNHVSNARICWATKTRLHALSDLRVPSSTTMARYAECQMSKLTWYVVTASSSIQAASLVLNSFITGSCLYRWTSLWICTPSLQVIEATCNHTESVFCLQLSGKFKPSCFNDFLPHTQVSESVNLRRGQAISAIHMTLSRSHLCWQLPMSYSAHFSLIEYWGWNWPFQIPS